MGVDISLHLPHTTVMTTQHRPQRKIISQQEAAKRLGVHRVTVAKHLRQGTIPHVVIGRRRVIYEDLFEEWLESQTHRPERAAS